jgi:hypothetical protein
MHRLMATERGTSISFQPSLFIAILVESKVLGARRQILLAIHRHSPL